MVTDNLVFERYHSYLVQENTDTRDRWVKSIQIIMDHQKKTSNFKEKAVKNQSWKWSGVSDEVSEKIRL